MRKRGRNYILWRMKYVRKVCLLKIKIAFFDFKIGSGRIEGERVVQIKLRKVRNKVKNLEKNLKEKEKEKIILEMKINQKKYIIK